MSYIFGGNTPMTYDAVQDRRRIARGLLQRSNNRPMTFGDGLAGLGEAIAARIHDRRAEKGEAIVQGEFDAQMQALMGGMSGAPMGGGGVTPSSRSYASSGGSAGASPSGSFGRIPTTDPDANDPRRSQFATAAPRANEDAAPVSTGPLQIFPETRATHSPSSGLNISMDFNASPNGGARGTEVIIPNNASPELRAAAEEYNRGVAEWAAANGIENYPVRGVRTVAENGRGVGNTVHTEPFFNDDLEMQRAIEADPHGFANIYANAFGGVDGRLIAPHGVGSDRGAASPVFGDETSYGERMAQALLGQGVRTPIPGDQSAPAVTMSAQNAPAMPQSAAMPQGGMPTAATDPKLAEYAQSMQIGGDPMSRLAAMGNLMGNQMASPGQQMVLQALMQQEMGRMQPQERPAPIEINGQLVDPITFEVLGDFRDQPEPGYRLVSPDEAQAMGLPLGNTYQVSPDNRVSVVGGGGTNIEVNTGSPEIGTIPQGYEVFTDENGSRRMRPIPGGPEDTTNPTATAQAQQSLRLIDGILNNPELRNVTGMLEGRLPGRNQAQTDLLVQVDQLQGQAFMQAFETLKGGGQITEREGAAATAAIARLNRAQSFDAYQDALLELRQIMEIGIQRVEGQNVPQQPQAPEPPAAPAASNDPPPSWGSLPEGTRTELRRRHTPEELAAFFEDFRP